MISVNQNITPHGAELMHMRSELMRREQLIDQARVDIALSKELAEKGHTDVLMKEEEIIRLQVQSSFYILSTQCTMPAHWNDEICQYSHDIMQSAMQGHGNRSPPF